LLAIFHDKHYVTEDVSCFYLCGLHEIIITVSQQTFSIPPELIDFDINFRLFDSRRFLLR